MDTIPILQPITVRPVRLSAPELAGPNADLYRYESCYADSELGTIEIFFDITGTYIAATPEDEAELPSFEIMGLMLGSTRLGLGDVSELFKDTCDNQVEEYLFDHQHNDGFSEFEE